MMDRRKFLQSAAALIAAPATVEIPIWYSTSVMEVTIDPLTRTMTLQNIRDLLLPGLWEVAGRYPAIECDWERIYATARPSADQRE